MSTVPVVETRTEALQSLRPRSYACTRDLYNVTPSTRSLFFNSQGSAMANGLIAPLALVMAYGKSMLDPAAHIASS